MKFLLLFSMLLLLGLGCAFGKPSQVQGSATFSIPFDFGSVQKDNSRVDEVANEMIKLEAEMIMGKKLQRIKELE